MKNDEVHWWEWGASLAVIVVLALAGAILLAPLVAGPTLDKIWPEVVKGLPAAFVALVIGIIAAGIAYRQMKIADQQRRVAADKLSFDLFRERYDVFLLAKEALKEATRLIGAEETTDAFSKLQANRARAHFLYGSEVSQYLDEVVAHIATVITVKSAMRTNEGEIPQDLAQEWRDAVRWIVAEAFGGVHRPFHAYLDFSRWRPADK